MEEEYDERVYELRAETELRFGVAEGSMDAVATLVLKRGIAEIFGTELLTKHEYAFGSNSKVSVFTWHGCTLTLSGNVEYAEVIKETPMIIYVNIHAAIEQKRQIADKNRSKGPTVLVAGPMDVGKSTMCKYLVNFAVRQGRTPIFVDLDVGQGQISIPATIGALVVRHTIDIDQGFAKQMPLVYHVGHKSPGHNIILYDNLVKRLASHLKMKMSRNPALAAHGAIINTAGWIKNDGYKSITKAILCFEVDVVLVIGKESLYHQLTRDVPSFVKVVYVPKFEGVIERSRNERYEERDNRVSMYFYGSRRSLNPYTFQVKFSDLKIYKISLKDQQHGNMPHGAQQLEHNLYLIPMKVGFNLLNRILAVTFSNEVSNDIIYKNIAGFICVTQIDMGNKKLSILSPEPPPLPNAVLLYSDLMFSRRL